MGYRISSVAFALLTLGGAVISAGYWPENPGWMVATAAGGVLYAFVAVLLWRRVEWAPAVGLGLAGFSAGLWLQSIIALGGSPTSTLTCGGALALSVATFGVLWLIPRSVSWRHGTSLAFAGAACVPGLVFALVPAQTIGVAAAMLVGSAALLTGAVFLGRGRTFGLLLNLVGAIVIAVGAAFAPMFVRLTAAHPMFPNGAGFLPSILGMSAAVLAAVSTAVYAGPLVRFLLRKPAE